MKFAQSLVAASLMLAAAPAAQALPVAGPVGAPGFVNAQLNCTGPRCLTVGPIRRPYLRGTRPPELPGRELFRRAPQPPEIRLQKPQMDYRLPQVERDRPLVRPLRPPDPSYPTVGLSQQHIQWCSARFRSYRESDNSYQPFAGPRRPCEPPVE